MFDSKGQVGKNFDYFEKIIEKSLQIKEKCLPLLNRNDKNRVKWKI